MFIQNWAGANAKQKWTAAVDGGTHSAIFHYARVVPFKGRFFVLWLWEMPGWTSLKGHLPATIWIHLNQCWLQKSSQYPKICQSNLYHKCLKQKRTSGGLPKDLVNSWTLWIGNRAVATRSAEWTFEIFISHDEPVILPAAAPISVKHRFI